MGRQQRQSREGDGMRARQPGGRHWIPSSRPPGPGINPQLPGQPASWWPCPGEASPSPLPGSRPLSSQATARTGLGTLDGHCGQRTRGWPCSTCARSPRSTASRCWPRGLGCCRPRPRSGRRYLQPQRTRREGQAPAGAQSSRRSPGPRPTADSGVFQRWTGS